jgi:hypothetical protein
MLNRESGQAVRVIGRAYSQVTARAVEIDPASG